MAEALRTLDDILGRLRVLKPELERKYRIDELAIFGSWARGEQTDASDLDVLVEARRGMTLFDLAGLQTELSRSLDMDVDVVTRNSLRPNIARQVLPERIVL